MTFVLVWAIPHLVWFVARSNYGAWSHALTPLGLNAASRIGQRLTYDFGLAVVMMTALRGRDVPVLSGLGALLRALPALLPAWLATQVDIAWDLWAAGSGWLRRGALPIDTVLQIRLTVSGLEILLLLTSTAAIGIFYPVVLEEGRSLLDGASRAWRLLRGGRWRFVALYLICLAMAFVISLPETWVLVMLAGAAVRGATEWITGGFSDLAAALWCVVVVASYVELRLLKEGASPVQVAEAFA